MKTFSDSQESENWAGGAAQVVECLTNNWEALNSIPSTAKKKKK
jgi:hypothetical protein